MAKDIVDIAISQLGYKEGAGNNTKYGKYTGANMAPWCHSFVSWCAYKAGESKGGAENTPPTMFLNREGGGRSKTPPVLIPEWHGLRKKDALRRRAAISQKEVISFISRQDAAMWGS